MGDVANPTQQTKPDVVAPPENPRLVFASTKVTKLPARTSGPATRSCWWCLMSCSTPRSDAHRRSWATESSVEPLSMTTTFCGAGSACKTESRHSTVSRCPFQLSTTTPNRTDRITDADGGTVLGILNRRGPRGRRCVRRWPESRRLPWTRRTPWRDAYQPLTASAPRSNP